MDLEMVQGTHNIYQKIQQQGHSQDSNYPPSLPGVLEDRDVLDGAVDGVRVLTISILWRPKWLSISCLLPFGTILAAIVGSFTENFIKIQHQEPHHDSTYHPSLFLES